nr:ATP-binding protein [Prosthecochloris sp. CIB 2401]
MTAQLPVNKWHDIIAEPTVADSIFDRLLGSAHRIELQGQSLRRMRLTLDVLMHRAVRSDLSGG